MFRAWQIGSKLYHVAVIERRLHLTCWPTPCDVETRSHVSSTSRLFLFVPGVWALFARTERSRNPLARNIAGAISGVDITVPAPVSLADGALIAVEMVGDQPILLVFSNSVSIGERPVFFRVRVAADLDLTRTILTV